MTVLERITIQGNKVEAMEQELEEIQSFGLEISDTMKQRYSAEKDKLKKILDGEL